MAAAFAAADAFDAVRGPWARFEGGGDVRVVLSCGLSRVRLVGDEVVNGGDKLN